MRVQQRPALPEKQDEMQGAKMRLKAGVIVIACVAALVVLPTDAASEFQCVDSPDTALVCISPTEAICMGWGPGCTECVAMAGGWFGVCHTDFGNTCLPRRFCSILI